MIVRHWVKYMTVLINDNLRFKVRKMLAAFGEDQSDLADLLGITYQSVSLKLNGHSEFKRSELIAIKQHYKLTPEQFMYIFFT